MSLLNGLKRRNVLRVGAAYVVVALPLIEAAGFILPLFGFDDDATGIVVIVLSICFIPTMILAWSFKLTPEGLKKESEVDHTQSFAPNTGKNLDHMIMVVLALMLSYLAFDKFVLSVSREASIAQSARQEGRSEAMVEFDGEKSIAVLPFVNTSSDEEQEYFSDGLSEELLNLLTKIPELRVTSRSSAFAFKGEKIDITEVAKKLNVDHILEGSVRKAGNQIRITAQLIEANSDTHLWAETYDRELVDIFAIQDEIAAEVVGQLKVTLLGDAPTIRETDPDAYTLYLQGRHLRRLRTVESIDQAQSFLQQALALAPDYSAAWDELGYLYVIQLNLGLRSADEGYFLAREAVNKALMVDPEYALAHASLGYIASTYDNDPIAAARHLERALQLDPANITTISSAASLMASLGRLDEAIALSEFVVARDPVSPRSNVNLGEFYAAAGRWDEAIESYNTALVLSPGYSVVHYKIGTVLLFKGESQAALEAMQKEESVWGMIGLVMAYRGEADRAFEWLDRPVLCSKQLFTRVNFQRDEGLKTARSSY